jgi:hypothetical protein
MHFVAGHDGYLGLQVGSYPSNTKIAPCSPWSATGAEGANCGPFVVGSPGVHLPDRPVQLGDRRAYRLRVAAYGEDAVGTWSGRPGAGRSPEWTATWQIRMPARWGVRIRIGVL